MDSVKKKAVRDYCDAVGRGDGAALSKIVTEDYSHEFLGTTVLAEAGVRTLDQILSQLELFSAALVRPGKFTFHEMVEEGDMVIAIFSGECELKNGRQFNGDYAAVCRFRGDKILSMRELMDTKLADSVLA
ncbi:nuclear transport factor 2 family protein [Sphingobium mellinum]|uniref:nuclear transport factor 2 family protein n=1 Tax=Sphingobium mellinum TaxID=1387166 RepID=UPI0030ED9CEB